MGEHELSQEDIDALFKQSGAPAPAGQPGPGALKSPLESGPPSAPSDGSVGVMAPAIEREQVEAQPVEFPPLSASGQSAPDEARNIDFLLDVPVTIAVELGRTAMVIRDALSLGSGSVVELNKLAGEPVDLLINNKLVARGE